MFVLRKVGFPANRVRPRGPMAVAACAFFLLAAPSWLAAAIPAEERAALTALYNSTNGDGWGDNTGWKTPPLHTDGFALPGTEWMWSGVIVSGDTVDQLYMQNNRLTGSLPSAIGDLKNLRYLDLGSNQLAGGIPGEIGSLANLQSMNLRSNRFTGGIPAEIGNLSNLQSLDLSRNQLTGSIPVQLWSLTSLYFLSLENNRLTGSIPVQIGNLINLHVLTLSGNEFSGSILAQIWNLTNLQYLDLSDNQLSGNITAQIGNSQNITYINLGENLLEGSIPTEIGKLTNLQGLALNYNRLAGGIPVEMGNLKALLSMDLSHNLLTGSIPAELENLASLQFLYLGNNRLTGSIPVEIGGLTDLRSLDLRCNLLDGSIPAQLGDLANLELLQLEENRLSGEIPGRLGDLLKLQLLYLGRNRLTGSIPAQIGGLTNLQSLWLNGNQLAGSIPAELGNLTNLVPDWLALNWNALHTDDDALATFLNSRQIGGDWESTQTIAPTGVAVGSPTASSLTVSWTPIAYTGDTGGYRVLYATSSGGPYTLFGKTFHKSLSSLVVTGLAPNTTYYFVVQTVTNPHSNNQNTVASEPSDPPARGTTAPGCATPTAIVRQPADAAVPPGGSAVLTVAAEGASVTCQWYRGASGDESSPLEGATGFRLTTPPLFETSRFWAKATGDCGSAGSQTAVVWVGGDIDGGGAVDGQDLLLLRQYLADALPPGATFDQAAADLDGDGRVDTVDLAILSRVAP